MKKMMSTSTGTPVVVPVGGLRLLSILLLLLSSTVAFTSTTTSSRTSLSTSSSSTIVQQSKQRQSWQRNPLVSSLSMGYMSPEAIEASGGSLNSKSNNKNSNKSVHPKIGDICRYYDIDGGNPKGQELVGKITYLTKTKSSWLAEVTELENVGDGYFAEYSSAKRMRMKKDRDLTKEIVSPIVASFVRSEQAFSIPLTSKGTPRVRQERYDLDDFEGPTRDVDLSIVEQDSLNYEALKLRLLKNSALTGLAGTVVTNIVKGPEDAVIYLAGAMASVGYLFFLSVKTDTLASADSKSGKGIANLRFLMPILVLIGVAVYNQSRGEMNNPMSLSNTGMTSSSPFDTVTAEQFGAAILGFLTYRVPLFVGQVQDALEEEFGNKNGVDGDIEDGNGNGKEGITLPGSAGVAMKLARQKKKDLKVKKDNDDGMITVLLVSGPQATGRTELVKQLLQKSAEQQQRDEGGGVNQLLVAPTLVDKIQDAVTFERLLGRKEILQVDPTGRYGWTKSSIFDAANNNNKVGGRQEQNVVVVVDASVALAQQLQTTLSGAKLIGVWVGLNSVAEFETRILADMESGAIIIPPEETQESVLRARIKDVVNEIDYGLSSGIFEFTILNSDPEQSLKELEEAAGYAFK